MSSIRDLFSTRRSIDRRIEKVIDYYAADEDRVSAEIDEYEATENVEECFRKFLETYQAGVQAGQVTQVGMWVSGFYGSGKSSFTKYLGFALDPGRTVGGRPFLDLLCDRIHASEVRASLRTVAKQYPTAVVMLDLGAEQLAASTADTVTNVLYWKVMQQVGFSKEKKLAQLEFTLDKRGLYDDFKAAYHDTHGDEWEQIHNDPLIGVSRASKLLPQFMSGDFPKADSFLKLRFEMADNVRDIAAQIIDLVRRHSGQENILFLIDEAGQYVAPRSELILNMDGLARNFKELGQGKVWIMATGQQTLTEIVEKAAHNSLELNKLRDRFPISIELDARDIREITYRRLLTKSDTGEAELRELFTTSGQAMITHTRLSDSPLFKRDPDADEFVKFYPFLPQHFEVLMELIRLLARQTGGIGLRSAIRVIQDVLVDSSRILPPEETKLADRPVGTLACVDDFYKTLRADITKLLPHVVAAVDKVESIFPEDGLHLRVAQAVAALQPLESFPRTAENIAALLYPALGHASLEEEVRQALSDLEAEKEIALTEDPQAGGYLFLSDSVRPLQQKRSDYAPTGGETTRIRNEILRSLLEPQPASRLENVKDVRAFVKVGKTLLIGDREDIGFRLEMVSAGMWDEQRTNLLAATAQQSEYRNVVVWLFRQNDVAEDILPEVRKSEKVAGDVDERNADRDVAQYARAERRLAERNREKVHAYLQEALLGGTFIFRGRPTPVRQIAETLETAARNILGQTAREVFDQYHLVNIRPKTNLAMQFLSVDRLDRMPADRDPLHLVEKQGGTPRVNVSHAALAETMRAFKSKVDESGGGRLVGKAVQDFFAVAPYGWSKDAVRYLFAALLVAGEIEFYTGGEALKTTGPAAIEAVKSTLSFNKIGVGLRDSKVSPVTLDRAAKRLQELVGEQVYPIEDHISRAARAHLPEFVERCSALPARLRLLGLSGEERAIDLLDQLTELLKGDAGDVPSRLGDPNSTLPEDIRWARAVSNALSDGGEDDIQGAGELLAELTEFETLFPGQQTTLATPGEIKSVREVLASERFHEQLSDLRSTMRTVHDRVQAQYTDARAAHKEALRTTMAALEAKLEWARLVEADREEIAARLAPGLPETLPTANPLVSYKTLLVHTQALPHLLAELEAEVAQRLPPPPLPDLDDDDPVETLLARDILPSGLITTDAELETWLSGLRELIAARLAAGKQVRFDL